VPEPSISEVVVAIGNLIRYKSSGADQIPAELIQAGEGEHYIRRSIILLSRSRTKKNCLSSGRNRLSYLFTKNVIKLSVVIIGAYHCCQLHTKFYPIFFALG
jgi:hypothetical protein